MQSIQIGYLFMMLISTFFLRRVFIAFTSLCSAETCLKTVDAQCGSEIECIFYKFPIFSEGGFDDVLIIFRLRCDFRFLFLVLIIGDPRKNWIQVC